MFKYIKTVFKRTKRKNNTVALSTKQKLFNQKQLFKLFKTAANKGIIFAPLTHIDHSVDKRQLALYLKHDIHDLDLDAVIKFANIEARLGIFGTFFFLPPDHPRIRSYTPSEQCSAMREILKIGHEIGLHIDPYFQIEQKQKRLGVILKETVDFFSSEGIQINIGNMHGNSLFKHPDNYGFGTSFDLFTEISRQPDYPELKNVSHDTTNIIKANRISIRDIGFTHWGDMPIWSAKHGFVVTNFMTDNRLTKQGTIELLVQEEALNSYQIAAKQPPGSRNRSDSGRIVNCKLANMPENIKPSHIHTRLDSKDLHDKFKDTHEILPLLILIHPEFYC